MKIRLLFQKWCATLARHWLLLCSFPSRSRGASIIQFFYACIPSKSHTDGARIFNNSDDWITLCCATLELQTRSGTHRAYSRAGKTGCLGAQDDTGGYSEKGKASIPFSRNLSCFTCGCIGQGQFGWFIASRPRRERGDGKIH